MSSRTHPWKVSDAPDEFVARQLRSIVGIEIAIERVVGKWKLSQNRDARDFAAVIEGLSRGGESERAVAERMRALR